MKTSLLYLEPQGGLANRMRMVSSYMTFAQKHNMNVKCVWKVNNELGTSFHSLFKEDPMISIIDHVSDLYSSRQNNKIKSIVAKVLNKLKGFDFVVKNNDIAFYGENLEQILLEKCVNRVCMYVCTCEELGYATDFSMFKPIDEIQSIIDEYSKDFTGSTIGLHIRRTDNKLSIDNSPLKLFENAINIEIIKNSAVNFYVTSDDPVVEKELKQKYGNKILIREKQYERETEAGIKDAVIDMYLLSRTSKIYGSFWSSFSDIASRIGNVELIVLKIN